MIAPAGDVPAGRMIRGTIGDYTIVQTELAEACRGLYPRLLEIRGNIVPEDRPEAFGAGDVQDERTRNDLQAIDRFLAACREEGFDR